MKLHIGCGVDYKLGYLNIDSSKDVKTDKVWDLEKTPLPFKDNQFEEVMGNHILEHIRNFVELMHELHRVCKKNAKIIIRTPFYSAWGQFNDPTHKRFFTPWTFTYFQKSKYSHEVNASKDMFDIKKVRIHFGIGQSSIMNKFIDPLLNLNHRFYCRFFAWIFPAAEIEYELRVLK